jgi:hypothetical protein
MIQDRIHSYFERNPKLHVLFIFDRLDMLRTDLNGVDLGEDYVYEVFDGAWFNAKYNIEYTWKDKKVVLLFTSDTYPHTEEQQLRFPLLDMLKANMEYKEEDDASFLQQYHLSEKFRPFIKRNIGEMTTGKVSALLTGHLTAEAFNEDIVCRAFLSNYLGEKRLLEWEGIIVRIIILGAEKEGKKRSNFFMRIEKNIDAKKALNDRLMCTFGVTYNPNTEAKVSEIAMSLKYNSITELLDTDKQDNYKELKIKNALQIELLNKVYSEGIQDRQLSSKFTDALKQLAKDIREYELIRIYGVSAPYFYMTDELCWQLIKALAEKNLQVEPSVASDRMRELGLKMPLDSDTQLAIRYVERVAQFYARTKDTGTLKLNSPEQYVQRYIASEDGFYLIDMFYRQALESYHELMTKDCPIGDTIYHVKKQMDQDYSKLTNVLNLEWLECVKEKGEYFNSLSIGKQEDIYEEEHTAESQVIIISDALRYEVATELMQKLASTSTAHRLDLQVRRAMLPTETKFCKNAMLPHRTLELQGADMSVDGTVLATIDQRRAHLKKYGEKYYAISYEELMDGPVMSKREIFKQYSLVYIYHDTIDRASHSQSPFEVIAACRKAIEELAVLIPRVLASWNVTNLIVTSDHGFIYNDQTFEEKDKHSITDDYIEKKTRYYLTHNKESVEGITKFPLHEVSAIKCNEPTFIAVPSGTNRLAAQGGYNFAHGGATLQEMLIPVIVGHKGKQTKTEKVGVSLMSHNLQMVSSRVKFQLIQSEAVSQSLMKREVVCCVYNGDQPVTEEKKVMLDSPDAANLNNRVFEVALTLNKSVSGSMLQLRVYDVEDRLNPLIRETVKNNTIIEQDF